MRKFHGSIWSDLRAGTDWTLCQRMNVYILGIQSNPGDDELAYSPPYLMNQAHNSLQCWLDGSWPTFELLPTRIKNIIAACPPPPSTFSSPLCAVHLRPLSFFYNLDLSCPANRAKKLLKNKLLIQRLYGSNRKNTQKYNFQAGLSHISKQG